MRRKVSISYLEFGGPPRPARFTKMVGIMCQEDTITTQAIVQSLRYLLTSSLGISVGNESKWSERCSPIGEVPAV